MPDGKKPGPVCLYRGASAIDAGTLARVCSPRPGPICGLNKEVANTSARLHFLGSQRLGQQSCQRPAAWIIVRATDIERAQMAVLRAIPKLPAEVRGAVAGL